MIYRKAKIKVKHDKATIDDPIILYRGDRNVEVQFEILDSGYYQYKIQNGNVIDNLHASFGQLVIMKPDETSLSSEVTPTEDGKIIFTIPGELIDEETELGVFTFQIRLFDETKESRVTLPPVTDGIELIEPIVNGDTY